MLLFHSRTEAKMSGDLPAYTPFDPTQVRRFSNDQINAAVADMVSHIPDDHTVALMAIADKASARVAVLIRPNEHWSFAGYLERPWTGELTYGAQTIVSF